MWSSWQAQTENRALDFGDLDKKNLEASFQKISTFMMTFSDLSK